MTACSERPVREVLLRQLDVGECVVIAEEGALRCAVVRFELAGQPVDLFLAPALARALCDEVAALGL